jgi:SAM-dependent methyltransferase
MHESAAKGKRVVDASRSISASVDQTRHAFNLEWREHHLGDRTWGMSVDDRVRRYFLEPLRMDLGRLRELVVLDAGCGNGSQSAAYTQYVGHVIAIDLSQSVVLGEQLRRKLEESRRAKLQFIQADLQRPPLAPRSVDVIHSAGVLHHTPDTRATFRTLVPLLRSGGTFYLWVYRYEPLVTPLVNALRMVTTRTAPDTLATLCRAMAPMFQLLTRILSVLKVRSYPRMARREATLALMDIFGPPYAHYHSTPEVIRWFEAEGFVDVWPCNRSRRGFGVCGRLP